MKILIPTIIYGRHDSFEVFAQGVKNLREAFDVKINVLAVGTGDKEVVEKHGFEYHEFPNSPLSLKAQRRLTLSRNRADYYMFLGSDDMVDEKLFAYYLKKMRQGFDLIASYDIHYYHKGEMYYSKGYPRGNRRHGEPLAVGRCVSNRLLGKFKWTLWDEKRDRCLDGLAWRKLKKARRKHFFYSKGIGIVMDVKTDGNVSKFVPARHEKLGSPEGILKDNIIDKLNGIQ